MVKLKKNGKKFYYSLLSNHLPRVLKFRKINEYISGLKLRESVLDYGSGDSPLKDYLLTIFKKYVAADYLATNAKHNSRPTVVIMENQRTDLPDSSFDCIILTEVLEHIAEPELALKEIRRLLKENGVIIGSIPFFQNEHEEPYDFYRYTYYGLEYLFKKNGFKVIEIDYIGDMLGVLIVLNQKYVLILRKILEKIHLAFIYNILNVLLKIPEIIYYHLYIHDINLKKIKYFKSYPLGFAFMIEKATETDNNIM